MRYFLNLMMRAVFRANGSSSEICRSLLSFSKKTSAAVEAKPFRKRKKAGNWYLVSTKIYIIILVLWPPTVLCTQHLQPCLGCLWIPYGPLINAWWALFGSRPPKVLRAFGGRFKKFSFSLQNPTIWVSMNSLGPQPSRFDIFELTQPLKGPKDTAGLLAGNSKISSF